MLLKKIKTFRKLRKARPVSKSLDLFGVPGQLGSKYGLYSRTARFATRRVRSEVTAEHLCSKRQFLPAYTSENWGSKMELCR